jgi:hypothetical protein
MGPMTQYQHVTGTETVLRDGTIKLHGPEAFEGMRKAGRLAAEILDEMALRVEPGVSTEDLDRVVRTAAASRSTMWCATASRPRSASRKAISSIST